MAPPPVQPRTLRIMKKALEVALPPMDSDPESSDDEMDSYNFLEGRRNTGFIDQLMFEEEENEEQTVDIEVFRNDIEADEMVVIDPELALNDTIALLISELEIATQLPLEDENGNETFSQPLLMNDFPSTTSSFRDASSSSSPSTNSLSSKLASKQVLRKTRSSPRVATSLAKSENIGKTRKVRKARKNIVKVKKTINGPKNDSPNV